jgi:hypothetical protein
MTAVLKRVSFGNQKRILERDLLFTRTSSHNSRQTSIAMIKAERSNKSKRLTTPYLGDNKQDEQVTHLNTRNPKHPKRFARITRDAQPFQ